MIKRLLLSALVASAPSLSQAQVSEPTGETDMAPVDRSKPKENTISTTEDGALRFTTIKYAEPASSAGSDANDVVVIRNRPCGPAMWDAPDIPDHVQAATENYHAERCERERQHAAAARARALANVRARENARAARQYERDAAIAASSDKQRSTATPRRRLIGVVGGAIDPETGQYYPGLGWGVVYDTEEGRVLVPGVNR